jgi:hypothetical protein
MLCGSLKGMRVQIGRLETSRHFEGLLPKFSFGKFIQRCEVPLTALVVKNIRNIPSKA